MNKQKVVLLIEDNEEILNFNREALLMEGYGVLTALTLNEARSKIADTLPDAIILDIMLPDGNGLDFCAELREQTDAPILFLTCLGEKEPLLQGLKAVGDDYITKPYDMDELLARIEVKLRAADIREVIRRGPLTLHLLSQQAFLNQNDLVLKPKEFAVLRILLENRGRTVAAEELYAKIWEAPMAGDSGAIWKQVSRLKSKLEKASGGDITIFSTRGAGYSLEI